MTDETVAPFCGYHGHDDVDELWNEAACKYHTSDAADDFFKEAFGSRWAQKVAGMMPVSEWSNEGMSFSDDDCLSSVSCESIDPSKYPT